MKCTSKERHLLLACHIHLRINGKGTAGLRLPKESPHHHLEPPACSHTTQRSSTPAVIVVQATQDWQGEDLAIIVMGMDRLTIPFWNLLSDALPATWLG